MTWVDDCWWGMGWGGVCVCWWFWISNALRERKNDKRSRGGSCIRERVSGVSVLDAPKFYIGNCHRNQTPILSLHYSIPFLLLDACFKLFRRVFL